MTTQVFSTSRNYVIKSVYPEDIIRACRLNVRVGLCVQLVFYNNQKLWLDQVPDLELSVVSS